MISLFIVFSLCANTAAGNILVPRELYQTKTDSFDYHYKIIDSILNRNVYDTSAVLKRSVRFIERITGIKAHPDGDYFGWRMADGKDLRTWREWKVEERIMDKVFALPEVKEKGRMIDSLTHHKRGVSIMIVEKPTAKKPYYWVKVGYDRRGLVIKGW